MFDVYFKIKYLLNASERRNAVRLFVMMVVMGLLDTIGVASIMPFVAVVANPGVIQTNEYLAYAYSWLGCADEHEFLLFLGAAVFLLILFGLSFKALTNWTMARYAHMRTYSIGSRLMQDYLRRPYSWFIGVNTAHLGKSVLSEVQEVTSQVLVPSIQLVANVIIAGFLFSLVVAVNPSVALTAVGVLGGAYALIYLSLRKYLAKIGTERVAANKQRFQVAQEVFGGIKEVKVHGLERDYIHAFSVPAKRFALHLANNQIIGQLPRFVLEGLVFGGMVLIILVLIVNNNGDLGTVLPMIAIYAFAGYRLMPALQTVYQAMTKVRFGKAALDSLYGDVKSFESMDVEEMALPVKSEIPLPLKQNLELRDVSFTYPQATKPSIEKLNLTIKANTTVAFIGSTGAGKTTIVDLILGLLVPQDGSVVVDGAPISTDNVRTWQRNIGYVPQHIFLTDDTVAANIALGVPADEIDQAAIERAAKTAELHDFVVSEMPQGYLTMVGERGVRLSGGQRQRIGIARALYHDPDVLILDEATSALDNITEKAVMDAVHNLSHRKTILMIAHRMTTVRQCDELFLLHGGKVSASGSYDRLLSDNKQFQNIVNG